MTAARLILLLLLILVAVVLVLVLLRRGSAQRDAQRVEAAELRSEADTLATTVTGQAVFADQAAERAEVARVEADAKAREAERLEAEAAEHRAAAEATRHDYEATMRRADDLDPDVKESAFAPVAEADGATPAAADPGSGSGSGSDDGSTMTRAERRAAREAEEAGAGAPAPSAASAAPSVGGAAGAAAGASAWANLGDEPAGSDSERIASAADFRDDVSADADEVPDAAQDASGDAAEVYPTAGAGTDADMSDDARTETAEHAPEDEAVKAGGAAGDSGTAQGPAADFSHDVESPRGEWGGPPRDEPAEMTVVGEPEAYAATEPLMAADQAPAVTPEPVEAAQDETSTQDDHSAPEAEAVPGDEDSATEDTGTDEDSVTTGEDWGTDEGTDHAPAVGGAAVAETADDDADSASDPAQETTEDRYDPTPETDWAADEGELLEQTHDRGERLEAERAELEQVEQEGDDVLEAPASEVVDHDATDTDEAATDETSTDATDDTGTDETSEAPATEGRRISGFQELRDGGFGVGSAAPIDDRAQPLDHPVQAYRDTMTFRVPGDPGYDSAEPDVWFYDEGAAERSGFRRADG